MLPVAELHVNNEQLPTPLEAIFRENYSLIYRTAYHLTGNAQDAEDVLQTVFLRLLRNESTPDDRRNPRGYLYRAAVNASLDLVRARRRHSPVDVEHLIAPAAEERSFDDAIHERL